MSLESLLPQLASEPVVAALAAREAIGVSIPEMARPVVLAAVRRVSGRGPLVIGVPTSTEADRLGAALEIFAGPGKVAVFPAWETLPFERVSPSVETMGRRLEVMWALVGDQAPDFVVASARALTQRIVPPGPAVAPVVVRHGSSLPDGLDPEGVVERLVAMGYRREYQVEHRGEVARRGSIVDVFLSAGGALRMDFFGDEVDRLTTLGVNDQRSGTPLDSAVIHACRELVPTPEIRAEAARLVVEAPWGRERWERIAEGMLFDGMESWLPWLVDGEHLLVDLVGAGGQIVLVEPGRMRSRSAELVDEEVALADTLAGTWGMVAPPRGGISDSEIPRLHLGFDRLAARARAPVCLASSVPDSPLTPTVEARGWGDLVPGDAPALASRISGLVQEGFSVVLCAHGSGSAERMAAGLTAEGMVVGTGSDALARPGLHLVVEPLDTGFVLPASRLAVLSELDVTGRHRAHRHAISRRKAVHRAAGPGVAGEGFFTDLAPGDYVVHRQHGVGRYTGMVRRALGGSERDYLLIEYRGNDKLYVPSDQLDQLTRYGGGETPALHRLGGAEFQRTQAKVRKAVTEIAQELVVLYSQRMAVPGHPFGEDTPWQAEVEESFPFEETPDQLTAIAAVKEDMESPHPMDRIVCGDVGFGKTEVALRAAFKAVQDGKQAAVLVPTTLLAQQHYDTFSERMAGYPIRVEMLSRFLTAGQSAAVVAGLADETVDIVIGTHRLLSEDVKIRNLGLLVVDEEHRFGVTHKEAIKAISTGVDVLTLTATPIPRTLEMGLTGIRDITVLATPPAARQPILTYVGEYDERAVIEAIRRELLREGQVFYVHNRVRDIHEVARRLVELVPDARVAVAHGQMDEGTLEKVVMDFADGRYDVLCCTTIIESGIDMPTVNTLVVDRADRLGLGQLHQLRGRVGRAGQRAYAYLLYPPEVVLSEEAFERLRTIGEHTELGSGLKIALRDLEIRGAGNLLGKNQSGHIAAVGYDLYVAMVGEALAELKGETPRRPAEVKLEVAVDAFLPHDYVARDDVRVEAYRGLATVEAVEEVEAIRTEWRDRYGPLPVPAEALLRVATLRAECIRCGVTEVTVSPGRPGGPFGGRAVARLAPVALKASAAVRLRRLHPEAVYKEPGSSAAAGPGSLVVPIPRGTADHPGFLITLLADLLPGPVA